MSSTGGLLFVFNRNLSFLIFASIIICSLFYLRTRGLNETDSKKLLIRSYYLDLIEDINNENFKNQLERLSNIWINEKI